MFRSHHQDPSDDTALTPPAWGLNNSGGTGVRGASTSDRAGSLSPSIPISATAQDRANIRGVEQSAARLAHNQEVVGSSPTPATSTQPDEGSAERLPAICSGGNGGANGAPAEPASSPGKLTQLLKQPSPRLTADDLGIGLTGNAVDRGANAVVVTRSAWEAMTRGCEVLGFDAVEVVR